jgi:3-phenylpropionate/trans-cinnamate dioxygenase ferredoxin reductase subunit
MTVVIVGAGLAGASCAKELREQGFDGDVTLIGAERHRPYQRPPLSKDVLLGKGDLDDAYVESEEWYAEHGVDLRVHSAVTAIDPEGHTVTVDDEEIAYDDLVLATGCEPRHFRMVDDSGADTFYLRTMDDAAHLKPRLGEHLLVIGAGWIGLEVASAARMAGGEVTVVESAHLPLEKVLGPTIAPSFAALHREHGVDLRLDASLDAVERRNGTTTAWLAAGDEIHPDLVLVGIGVEPRVDLAEQAGLDVDNGILVDASLRASADHVWAIGDVANHDHPLIGRVRVEHWDTAIQHGKHVARAILGDHAVYDRQPYFFTDQYDLGMEYVGHAHGDDEVVVRGSLDGDRVFAALWIRDGRITAGMHANDWDAIDPLRALVGTEADDRTRDPAVPLADLI